MKSIALVEYFAAAAAGGRGSTVAAAAADRRGPVGLRRGGDFFQTRATDESRIAIYRNGTSGCHQGKERNGKERIAQVQGAPSQFFGVYAHFTFFDYKHDIHLSLYTSSYSCVCSNRN